MVKALWKCRGPVQMMGHGLKMIMAVMVMSMIEFLFMVKNLFWAQSKGNIEESILILMMMKKMMTMMFISTIMIYCWDDKRIPSGPKRTCMHVHRISIHRSVRPSVCHSVRPSCLAISYDFGSVGAIFVIYLSSTVEFASILTISTPTSLWSSPSSDPRPLFWRQQSSSPLSSSLLTSELYSSSSATSSSLSVRNS